MHPAASASRSPSSASRKPTFGEEGQSTSSALRSRTKIRTPVADSAIDDGGNPIAFLRVRHPRRLASLRRSAFRATSASLASGVIAARRSRRFFSVVASLAAVIAACRSPYPCHPAAFRVTHPARLAADRRAHFRAVSSRRSSSLMAAHLAAAFLANVASRCAVIRACFTASNLMPFASRPTWPRGPR